MKQPNKILHLTLHKQYFDAIAKGEKTKENREKKPYWKTRLENREYTEIHFKNGYAKNSPFMRVEFKHLEITKDKYIIHLGKILEIKDYA